MSRLSRLAAATTGLAVALGVGAITAPGAQAAAGDAFDPARPLILIGQGDPTQMSIAQADAAGAYAFTDVGTAADLRYNALSFDTDDNYLYAFSNSASATIPNGALLKIASDGTYERVGTTTYGPIGADPSFNIGAFNPDDGYLYVADTTDDHLYVIDPADATQVNKVTLSETLNVPGRVSDWAFSGGYLWGLGDGNVIARIDPVSGAVDSFSTTSLGIDPSFAGAAWTYMDDSLGFSHNVSGEIDRIKVTDPGAATPTFTLVKKSTGPGSSNNDAAMVPGLPADLGVTKKATLAKDGSVTYTIVETNHGKGWSTGSTVTDDVPSAVNGVAATSSDATCSVAAQTVTCAVGELAPGATATMTVTGQLTGTAKVKNTVSVVGNEPDPNPANDNASASVKLPPPFVAHPKLTLKKTATPARVSRAGQVVRYRFKVKNAGNVVIKKVHVVEGSFSGTGHMTRPKCPKATLKPGQSEVCTAKYKVTKKDAKKKRIKNTARAAGVDPSGKSVRSKKSTAAVRVVHLPLPPNTGARRFF